MKQKCFLRWDTVSTGIWFFSSLVMLGLIFAQYKAQPVLYTASVFTLTSCLVSAVSLRGKNLRSQGNEILLCVLWVPFIAVGMWYALVPRLSEFLVLLGYFMSVLCALQRGLQLFIEAYNRHVKAQSTDMGE